MTNVVINSDKTISVNGKKIFPLMMFTWCYPTETSVSQCSINLREPYDIDIFGLTNDNLQFVQAHEQANKYFVIMNGATSIATFKSSPSMFGYLQTSEEIDINTPAGKIEHDRIKNIYNSLKISDPAHVVLYGLWYKALNWTDTADIILSGTYPFRLRDIKAFGGNRDYSIYNYEYKIKNEPLAGTNDFDTLSKPVFPVIQALAGTDESGTLPITQKELRVLEYTAITMNVKGLSHYVYSASTIPGSALDNDLNKVIMYANAAKEIKSLNYILVLPTADYSWEYRKGTRVSFSKVINHEIWGYDTTTPYYIHTSTNFNYMLKQEGNTWYLIIVNKDVNPISSVQIKVNGISGVQPIQYLGNETTGSARSTKSDPSHILSSNNGLFTDSFDGYAVHIYQIGVSIVPPPCLPPQQVSFTVKQL